MKATPYVTGGVQRIVLSDDQALPKAQQSVFLVQPLEVDELYAAVDALGDGRFQTLLGVVVRQLREVRNFPAGAPEPYPADGTLEQKKRYVAQLRVAGVRELGNAILDQTFLKDDGPEVD